MKAKFDDHVITIRPVELPDGGSLPPGTHGFVVEVLTEPEGYEVEFDLEDGDQILTRVGPDDISVA